MERRHLRGRRSGPGRRRPFVTLTLGAMTLGALVGATALATVTPAAAGGALATAKVALAHDVPALPADVSRLGAVPGTEPVSFDVALAGQDPSGLAAAVAAVSTPGSPDYRRYLSAAQYAASYGPSAGEVTAVSAALRGEGLTVGTIPAGGNLLPVSGTAAQVSAALSTPLESVRLPGAADSLVNTAPPEVPAAIASAVTAVIGLDGVAQEHAMLLPHHQSARATAPDGSPTAHANTVVAHAAGPQACDASAATAGKDGSYTSSQLAATYGLSQLFAQGRTGVGQTIALVEFEQFSAADIAAFESCYGLHNPLRVVTVDGPVGGPSDGSGEAALDIEMAAVSAPSASLLVYEAPNQTSDASSLAMFERIASDDAAQVVSTSWGICEALNAQGNATAESAIFNRMAVQGQTVVAAAGDAGSEDCFDTVGPGGAGADLAIDDPGAQPDVVSAGGTSLAGSDVATQTVWNNCEDDAGAEYTCAQQVGNGAGGGGYSDIWAKPTWQPDPGLGVLEADPCGAAAGCRSVPDLSGSADPDHGVTAYFTGAGGWTVFGGTSVVAPSDAALFADTNQGCARPLGMVGPALYAVNPTTSYTDVTAGNNDLTNTNAGLYGAQGGYDAASGLGTPQDQNLALALQGGDGCPSVADMSGNGGPITGAGELTIAGGGFGGATSVNFGSAGAGTIVANNGTSVVVIPPSPGRSDCVNVTVTNPQGTSVVTGATIYGFGGAGACGYRFVAADGGIFAFGTAPFEGSTGNIHLNQPIVGMATTSSGNGYWLVASDGGIFAFGDAHFYGSMGGRPLNRPIVSMAATPDGAGYWLVASDGGIFSFGDARFYGSTGSIHLNRPVVGMASTPNGAGYYMVASDGGIFTYGDAQFHGSAGSLALVSPVVGLSVDPAGTGYWLVAADGGIFTYGSAQFHGSAGTLHLNAPIAGMADTPDGGGYWLVGTDGGIFTYGDAQFFGSTGNLVLNKPIVGMAAG